jgi:hypothetical protein
VKFDQNKLTQSGSIGEGADLEEVWVKSVAEPASKWIGQAAAPAK